MYKRLIRLPAKPGKSFFLWGPRQTGKTTLLKSLYPDALRIDLLKTEELVLQPATVIVAPGGGRACTGIIDRGG